MWRPERRSPVPHLTGTVLRTGSGYHKGLPSPVRGPTSLRSNILVLFCKTRLIFIVYLYLNQSFPEINKNKIRHQCEHVFKKKKKKERKLNVERVS